MSLKDDSVDKLDYDFGREIGSISSHDEEMQNSYGGDIDEIQNAIADRFIDSLDLEVVPDKVIEDFLLNYIEDSEQPPDATKCQTLLKEAVRSTVNNETKAESMRVLEDCKSSERRTKGEPPSEVEGHHGPNLVRAESKPGVVWVDGIDSSSGIVPALYDNIMDQETEEGEPGCAIPRTENIQRYSMGSLHSSLRGSLALDQQYLVEAETVEHGDGLQGSIIATAKPDPWWRRNLWWLTVLFALATIGVAIVIVFVVTGVNETDAPTFSPTTLEYGEEERILNLIVSHFPPAEESLRDQSTSEYEALKWVAERNVLHLHSRADELILQQYSLAAFYLNMNSNGWKEYDGWLDNENECSWYGVECGMEGSRFENKVIGLNLPSNGLSGSIPADIAILSSSLSSLVLDRNGIMGSIPPEIGHLSLLSILNLSDNELSGALPGSIGEMANLLNLNLSKNSLSSTIPAQLGMLSLLRSIKLGNNELVGSIPSQIGELTDLQELDFRSNELSYALPKEIGSVSTLEKLFLQDNKLLGPLPSEMGSLSKLQVVDMSRNYVFDTIPAELWQMGGLPNLEHIDLSHNLLTGTLSDDFGKSWLGLKTLRLGGKNFLKGTIPSTVYTFNLLEELDMSSNFLTGTMPISISNLGKLHTLNLSGNRLEGNLPETLYLLTDLQVLELNNNSEIEGTLTSLIEKLPRLTSFGVSGVSGTIPPELWSLTLLKNLELSHTKITDMLSSDLGALSRLTSLMLRGNKSIGGALPTELRYLTALSSLQLGNNRIEGTIPTEVGLLTNLEVLDARNNIISGSFPTEMGHMTALKDLNTGINKMTGVIPSEFGHLTNLRSLRPGANLLKGSIPTEIGRLTNMQDLRLVLTQLSGPIPSEFRNLMKLKILYLYETTLTGSIPDEICTTVPQPFVNVDCKEVICHCCGCTEYNPSTYPSLSPIPTQTPSPTRFPSSLPTFNPSQTSLPSGFASSLPTFMPSITPVPSAELLPTLTTTSFSSVLTVTSGESCSPFTSISSNGTLLSDFDEDNFQVVDLPFEFNFRLSEDNYTTITVDRNGGRIILGTENLEVCGSAIVPSSLYYNGGIANAFSGNVYTSYIEEPSTAFIVSWEGEFTASYNSYFQAVLFSTGDIEIRWGSGMYPNRYKLIATVANSCINQYINLQGYPFTILWGPVMTPENGVWPSDRCAFYYSDVDEGYITNDVKHFN